MSDYRPIETAPRDGTVIEVACPGEEGPFEMRWTKSGFNPSVSKQFGLWVDIWGNFTWCEDHGFGPTHWRPLQRK